MLPRIFENQSKAFFDMSTIGSYLYSFYVSTDYWKVAKFLTYYNDHDRTKLTNELSIFLRKEQHTLFSEQFDPQFPEANEKLINSGKCFRDFTSHPDRLIEILESNSKIYEKAERWYKLIMAINHFGHKIKDIESCLQVISETKIFGEPRCMVNTVVFSEYYKKDKSEFELAQFACYAAIKSIIGKNIRAFTNKNHIVARMLGGKSIKTLSEKDISNPLYVKYSKRYHMDKLLFVLQKKWGLTMINIKGQHGFFLSFKLSLDELATYAVEMKQRDDKALLREAKNKALTNALLTSNDKHA
jgi:hypothetical protein